MSPISHFHTMRTIRPTTKLRSKVGTQTQLVRPNIYPLQRHRQQSRRGFHIGPTIGAALEGTQDLILSIHNVTHTPWFITIPLVALGVNLLFRLPFQIYTHKIQQRRAKLAPILQAWNVRINLDLARERVSPARHKAEAEARFNRTTARVWKKFGLQDWKLYANILGLPFWLAGIESVRRLCGGPKGILGHLFFGSGSNTVVAAATETAAAMATTAAEAQAVKEGAGDTAMSSSVGTSSIPVGSVPVVDPSAGSDVAETIAHATAEPSLTTEGVLWFPDLTVPDPWHVLPFALSAVLVLNLLPKSAIGRRALLNMSLGPPDSTSNPANTPKLTSGARGRLVLYRSMFPVALLVGPLTMDIPAALHLYWISSSACGWATAKVLAWLYPVGGNAVEMCKGVEIPVIRPKRDLKMSQVMKEKSPKKAKA